MKRQIDKVLENALQILMNHDCWIHERAWNGSKHLTRIENPAGSSGLWNDEQIINKAITLEPNKCITR